MEEIDRIINFLGRHTSFAKTIISMGYPFSHDELSIYTDKLNWYWISCNGNIVWSESLFKEFESKINMEAFSGNETFPWTEEFIDEHFMDLFY